MHYHLFHPVFSGTHDDSAELMKRFMAIGDSYGDAMATGALKIKELEGSPTEKPLLNLISGFRVTGVSKSYSGIVEKIIERFGKDLSLKDPADKSKLSMVALLLHRERLDIIDQVLMPVPMRASEFSA